MAYLQFAFVAMLAALGVPFAIWSLCGKSEDSCLLVGLYYGWMFTFWYYRSAVNREQRRRGEV